MCSPYVGTFCSNIHFVFTSISISFHVNITYRSQSAVALFRAEIDIKQRDMRNECLQRSDIANKYLSRTHACAFTDSTD